MMEAMKPRVKRNRDRQKGVTLEELEDKYLLDPLSCANPKQVQELCKLREGTSDCSIISGTEGNTKDEQG